MLLRTGYDRHYVAACRESVGAAVEELRRVEAGSAAWNQLVPALDRWFSLRNPKVEGRDGNPINEVRVIAESITEHGSVMTVPRGMKLIRRPRFSASPGARKSRSTATLSNASSTPSLRKPKRSSAECPLLTSA